MPFSPLVIAKGMGRQLCVPSSCVPGSSAGVGSFGIVSELVLLTSWLSWAASVCLELLAFRALLEASCSEGSGLLSVGSRSPEVLSSTFIFKWNLFIFKC